MQFVANGPEIPERLLQSHEDGRVVFFCGAGISYPAGLPDFKGLTHEIFRLLDEEPEPAERAAMGAGRFDLAIGLLEGRLADGRAAVRKALARTLQPDGSKRDATATHRALLRLARDREDRTRLITTNFDCLFEQALEMESLEVERFEAPLLPVPKRRWNGVVYLHGLLGASPTRENLERLVVSGGDFGLAYLTERWAARFVSELLRQLHRRVRRIQPLGPGAPIHDGRARCGPAAGRAPAGDVRLRESCAWEGGPRGGGMDGQERHADPVSELPAPLLSSPDARHVGGYLSRRRERQGAGGGGFRDRGAERRIGNGRCRKPGALGAERFHGRAGTTVRDIEPGASRSTGWTC